MSRLSFALTFASPVLLLALSSPAQPAPSQPASVPAGQQNTNLGQSPIPSEQPPRIDSSPGTMTTPEQLRRIAPPSPAASAQELESQADILRARKLYADSLDYYHAALKKSGDNDVLYNKMGIANLQMLRLNDAKKDFERAAKANRNNAEAQNNLGVVYYEQHNYRRAIKYYSKAIELSPDSASFHSNLGTAYFSHKDYEKANVEYAKALMLDPEVFEHHNPAGVSMHTASPEDRARFSYVIAKMYAKTGDADRCLQYLRKAMEEGFAVAANFAKDPEFAGYRKDARFTSLLNTKAVPLPN
jgi:tetratricopeptide (TPR) repeat protein